MHRAPASGGRAAYADATLAGAILNRLPHKGHLLVPRSWAFIGMDQSPLGRGSAGA